VATEPDDLPMRRSRAGAGIARDVDDQVVAVPGVGEVLLGVVDDVGCARGSHEAGGELSSEHKELRP
jgi:hypothetical protein